MNYITTDSHEYLKAGILYEYDDDNKWYVCKYGLFLTESRLIEYLSKGWIVEQQKPEFTKDDCLSFAAFWYLSKNNSMEKTWNEWLTNRNK